MRALPIASGLLFVALAGGAWCAWRWLRDSRPDDDALDARRGVAGGAAHDVVPSPAEESASPSIDGGAAASPSTPRPRREVARVPDVDVHGWFVVWAPGGRPQTLEQGRVVLASTATSRSTVRVEVAVANGTFDTRLPSDAVVEVAELELGGKPVAAAREEFDVAQSHWLEIHGVWSPPITLKVVDAASGDELTDVQLADEQGRSLRDRVQPRTDRRGAFDSPLVLRPAVDARALSCRTERIRMGAAGRATLEVEVELGHAEPVVVALRRAARLTVALTPWPPDAKSLAGRESVTVALHRRDVPRSTTTHDDPTAPWNRTTDEERARTNQEPGPDTTWTLEKTRRRPDADGVVVYDDLAAGSWLVAAEFSPSPSEAVVFGERLVETSEGVATTTPLAIRCDGLAPATMRLVARDARTGSPVEMRSAEVRFARLDGLPIETRSLTVPTMAGTVEIHAHVLGERAWEPVHRIVDLLPGEDVVELELVPTSAVAVTVEKPAPTPAAVFGTDEDADDYLSRFPQFETRVALRNAAGVELQPTQRHETTWWLVPPGRYELVLASVRRPDAPPHVLRTIDVAAESVVRETVTAADLASARTKPATGTGTDIGTGTDER